MALGIEYFKLFSVGVKVVDEKGHTNPQTKEIAAVAEAFNENMTRVVTALNNAPFLVGWTLEFHTCMIRSDMEIFGTLTPSREQLADTGLIAKRVAKMREYHRDDMADVLDGKPGRFLNFVRLGTQKLEELCAIIPPLSDGINEALGSAIIGSWTAFEVLLGDLWEAAVNCYPDCMLPQATTTRRGGKRPKGIDPEIIRALGYDLRGKIGSAMRRHRNFTSMPSARRAYHRAFKDKKIDGILRNPEIDFLQGMRHILVHNCGKIDRDFIEQVKDCVGFPSSMIGKPLGLWGGIVECSVCPVLDCAQALILQVDKWVRHKTTT